KVTQCPSLSPPPGFFQYQTTSGATVTGGYGYNKAVGNQKMVFFPTSQTYLFSDAALLVNWGGGSPWMMQETDAIVGPNPSVKAQPWGTYQAMTHFRHTGVASMAFLDGHVETVTPAGVPNDPTWPAGADVFRQKNALDFPTNLNTPYTG